MNEEKHQFSLYWPQLSKKTYTIGSQITITDLNLYHRICRVVRLQKNDQVVLFDRHYHLSLILINSDKINILVFEVSGFETNTILKPPITFLLPLLKRDAFEHAIYSLVELGANEIQLVATQKIQRKWGGQKELDRLEKIIIAAAEQSKNYVFPSVYNPTQLKQIVSTLPESTINIFFDPQGIPAFELIQTIHKKLPKHIVLLVGPEGDLALQEKELLVQSEFSFCTLTPTILRAQQAATVSLGLIRSLL